MQHTPNLNAVRRGTIKDKVIAKTFHAPGSQTLVTKLRSCPPSMGILREKLEAIVSTLQKASRHDLIVCSKPAVNGLQIAEHILAFLKAGCHYPAAMMRSMLLRSPVLKRPRAASSRRSWMRGGVSASSAIHLSKACRVTSSASRYPSVIWRWIKASIWPVTVISMGAILRSTPLRVKRSAKSRSFCKSC